MIKYWEIFLRELKALLFYFFRFKKINIILPKEYPKDCAINDIDKQPIIIITNNESIFSANNNYQKVWMLEKHQILCLERKKKDIMVSNFHFSWLWLNLLYFSSKKQ